MTRFDKKKLIILCDFNRPGIDCDCIKSGVGSVIDVNAPFDITLDHNHEQVIPD